MKGKDMGRVCNLTGVQRAVQREEERQAAEEKRGLAELRRREEEIEREIEQRCGEGAMGGYREAFGDWLADNRF
jgi:hypothetical protein